MANWCFPCFDCKGNDPISRISYFEKMNEEKTEHVLCSETCFIGKFKHNFMCKIKVN